MSHQTGIKANEKLLKVFGKAKNGKLRAIKISIENEELYCADTAELKKDCEKDFERDINTFIEDAVPCYILFRLDGKTTIGYNWLLFSWVPENASIRQKMVYASTKATLKMEFGSAHITEEYHATTKDEATWENYQRYKNNYALPAPLSMREEELAQLRKTEINTEINTETKQQTLSGISCPLTSATLQAIKDFQKGSYDYLQLRIDLDKESIDLSYAGLVSLNDLPKYIPEDHARYHLYLFKHKHEGNLIESIIFIYSMPGYSCSVKERMMYSSSKAPLVENLQHMGIDISKKLEIDNGSDLNADFLLNELHPKQMLGRPSFAKPKGPPNRGAKRLTKAQD